MAQSSSRSLWDQSNPDVRPDPDLSGQEDEDEVELAEEVGEDVLEDEVGEPEDGEDIVNDPEQMFQNEDHEKPSDANDLSSKNDCPVEEPNEISPTEPINGTVDGPQGQGQERIQPEMKTNGGQNEKTAQIEEPERVADLELPGELDLVEEAVELEEDEVDVPVGQVQTEDLDAGQDKTGREPEEPVTVLDDEIVENEAEQEDNRPENNKDRDDAPLGPESGRVLCPRRQDSDWIRTDNQDTETRDWRKDLRPVQTEVEDRSRTDKDGNHPPEDRNVSQKDGNHLPEDRNVSQKDGNHPPEDRNVSQKDGNHPPEDRNFPQRDGNHPQEDQNFPQKGENHPLEDKTHPQKDKNCPSEDRSCPRNHNWIQELKSVIKDESLSRKRDKKKKQVVLMEDGQSYVPQRDQVQDKEFNVPHRDQDHVQDRWSNVPQRDQVQERQSSLPQQDQAQNVVRLISHRRVDGPSPLSSIGTVQDQENRIALYVKAGSDGESLGNCPFSQRLFMILLLKRVQFTVTTVDLKRKPAELKDLAPGTKPPFLTFQGELKTDVNQVEEFLEDKLAPPRFPRLAPRNREANTAGIDVFAKFSAFIKNPRKNTNEVLQQSLLKSLQRLDVFLRTPLTEEIDGDAEGETPESSRSFLDGDQLTLADCNLLPKLHILQVVAKKYRDFEVPAEMVGVRRYLDRAAQRSEFCDSCPSDREIQAAYLDVAQRLR